MTPLLKSTCILLIVLWKKPHCLQNIKSKTKGPTSDFVSQWLQTLIFAVPKILFMMSEKDVWIQDSKTFISTWIQQNESYTMFLAIYPIPKF